MDRSTLASVVILILVVAGVYWYATMDMRSEISAQNRRLADSRANSGKINLGTYPYECEDDIDFTLTIAPDEAGVVIRPKDHPEYPPTSELRPIATPQGKFGKWFSDNKTLLLIGRGESVTLQEKGTSPVNCSPVADPNNPSWKWGI